MIKSILLISGLLIFGNGGCSNRRVDLSDLYQTKTVTFKAEQPKQKSLIHQDFSGHDEFDYAKEDFSWSCTKNLFCTWRHFRQLKNIERDVNKAIEVGNKDQFERYTHQGQDYFAHVWRRSKFNVIRHVFNQDWDSTLTADGGVRWQLAEAWTKAQLVKWHERK